MPTGGVCILSGAALMTVSTATRAAAVSLPEPGSMGLVGIALVGAVYAITRKKK